MRSTLDEPEIKRLRALIGENPTRYLWAVMILVMIRQGWNPPPPDDRAMERMLDDMRGIGDKLIPANATNELTERERQMLALLSTGMDQPAIAQALGISHETVRTRTKIARRKLGASTNTQAVAIAMRAGLVR